MIHHLYFFIFSQIFRASLCFFIQTLSICSARVTPLLTPMCNLKLGLPPCVETETMRRHCITRVVDRAFILQRKERDMMLKIIRKYEAFCGVRVLAY